MRLAYLTEPGAPLSFAGEPREKTLFRHDAAAKPSTPTISMHSFANSGRRTERAMSGQYAGVAPFRDAGHCSNCGRQF
jgi:hypothetical protein